MKMDRVLAVCSQWYFPVWGGLLNGFWGVPLAHFFY